MKTHEDPRIRRLIVNDQRAEAEPYKLYWRRSLTAIAVYGLESHLKARELAVDVVRRNGGWAEIWRGRRLVSVVEKGDVA